MVAVAIGGAAVIGGVSQYASGKAAAKAQGKAADQQVAESQRQYDTTRADYAPWRTAGTGALSKLSALYGISTPGTVDWQKYISSQPDVAADYRLHSNMTPEEFGQWHYARDGSRRDLSKYTTGGTGGTPDYSSFTTSPGYQFRLDEGQKAIERSAAARGGLNSGATLKALERFAQGTASDEFNRYVGGLQSIAGLGQNAQNATTSAGQQSSQNIINAYGNAGNARASSYANTGSAINSGINNVLSAYLMTGGGGGSVNPYGIQGGNIY